MFGGAPNKSYNTKYYEILGVSTNASQDDVKNAYTKAAEKVEFLPYQFKELTQAYGVLGDPEKREIYDQYGEDGRDLVRPLMVSLKDLYSGTSKKQHLSRIAICSKCKGKGSKSGASMTCSGCRGSGTKYYSRPLGPSMTQHQMARPCYQCKGTGQTISETITDEDRCEECKGEKVVQEKKVLEVHVEKGMQNGQNITFPREAFITVTGGGLVFILQQKEHPKFKRNGDDLFVEHTLSLKEALSGFQFVLTHLDNRQLIIKSQPGEVVKPGQFKAIDDEGMPMYQRPLMRGKLYIHFTVEFPDSVTPVLPPRPSPQVTDTDGEETALNDVNIEDEMRRKHQQVQEAYDEDMPGGSQRVQ